MNLRQIVMGLTFLQLSVKDIDNAAMYFDWTLKGVEKVRVGQNKLKKNKVLFSFLILFSFVMGILPMGMKGIKAEEINAGDAVIEKIELVAEVLWIGVPEEVSVPEAVLNLISGDEIIESVKVSGQETQARFSPVDKYDGEGNPILYGITQDPLEGYDTAIKEFLVENTFIVPEVKPEAVEEPIPAAPIKEPVVEEPIAIEEPVINEPDAPIDPVIVEEPIIEEKPLVEEPIPETGPEILEEPVSEEPVPEDPIEIDVPSQIGLPAGPDELIVSNDISDIPVYETLGLPEVKSETLLSQRLAPAMESMMTSMVSPTIPGQVTIDKYAEPVPGLVNTWDITLRIEGMDTAKSSDIVLVIDRSGSMLGTKLAGAKTAAKAFVAEMIGKPNTRIAVVSFASAYEGATTVTTNQTFTTNATALNTAIDSLVALGGTNTQAGIKRAAELLAGSSADYKNMVLLSDGQPTQSYVINSVTSKLIPYNRTEEVEILPTSTTNRIVDDRYVTNVTTTNLQALDFNYTTTMGGGYASWTYIVGTNSQSYYSHGNSAIAEANMFKNTVEAGKQRTLWTIALETTTYGNQVLNAIASPGKAYTASTSDLNTIFLQIAGSINAAARDAVVVDPMATGFEIPASEIANITKTQGTVAYVGGVLTWTVGDLYNPISPGSSIKYAELTYRVSITDAILGLAVPADGLYPTNGDTEISYKDSNGITQELDFPIPEVNPIFLKVKKTLQDSAGNVITDPLRSFAIRIRSDAADGDTIYAEYDQTYNLIPDQLVTKTNLRLADLYTVSETAPDYDVTIKVNGVVTSTFIVDPPVGLLDSGQEDISVEVINKEKPLGKLILKKILLDENDDPILNDIRTFTFNVTGPNGYTATRDLVGGETVEIPGLAYGLYTVTETAPGTGFTVTSVPLDGKVTLAWNNKEGTATITNKYVSPKINVIAKKIWENGKEEDHVAVTLTLYRQVGAGPKSEVTGIPAPTILPATGTASEFVYTWSNLPERDVHGNLYIYSADELMVPTGYDKINVDPLTVKNKAKTSSLQLLKTGVDDAPLQGAEFDLYRKVTDPTGAVAFDKEGGGTIYGILIPGGRLITGADGKTQIVENLEVGDYFVVERVAPSGYLIHEYPIEFTVVATTLLNEFTIENELAPMIPATGGMGTWLFTILGAGVMGGALLGFKKYNQKNRGKGENIMKGRKLFTLLFTILILFVFAAPTMAKAVEIDSVPAPPMHYTDVTIHKIELKTMPTTTLPANHDGDVLTEAELIALFGANNYAFLEGVVFSYWKVNSGDTIAVLNAMTIAQLDAAYDRTDLAPTNASGVITIPDLADGFYYFRETFTPVNVTQQIAVPFLLGLPVMKLDGTGFIEDLHIYPKNLTVRGAVVLTKYGPNRVEIPGAKFRLYKGVSPTGVEYDPEGPALPMEYTTNSEGEIIINNLPVGNYYFVETATVSPYLLDQTPIPFTITANGFVTVVDELRTATTGDVKFVSHFNYEEPDVTKSIVSPGTLVGSGDYHEPIKFYIDIKLPPDILEYTMLEVSDMISTKLDYKDSLVVSGSTNGTTFNPLTLTTQYTVPNQPAVDGDGLLKVVFVPAALKAGEVRLTYIRITFMAAINETAIMGQGIPNSATVNYNNGYTPGDDTSNDVKAYTGGKNFRKVDGQLGLAGAEFAVKNGAGKFLKIGAGGVYEWVDTLALTTFRLTSDANGYFEIKGLEYAIPGGTTYYLYETKAPMSAAGYPYNLIETDIPFLVNATSYYADPTVITMPDADPTATPQGVVNILGPKIPQTGGIGTVLFTLIGGGLMGSAVMLNKKRSRS